MSYEWEPALLVPWQSELFGKSSQHPFDCDAYVDVKYLPYVVRFWFVLDAGL